MIKELYIQCYFACLIGNIIHLAVSYKNRLQDFKTANEPLSLWSFIKMEKGAIIADFVGSMGLVYVADEWISNEYVMGKIKTAFVLVGITGSWLVMAFASVSKAVLRKRMDEKSNLADYGTKEKPK